MRKRNNFNYFGVGIGVLAVAVLALWYYQLAAPVGVGPVVPTDETPVIEEETPQAPEGDEPVALPRQVSIAVPFLSQAPFGEWEDPRQQDGCEEASLVMAKWWLAGTSGSAQQGKDEILTLSALAEEMFGSYHDSSAADTLRLLQRAVPGVKAEVKYSVTAEQIKQELAKGKVVIVPADGRRLNNPNFSGGGPERHMLLIRGYDEARQQFITNDPGTRRGEGYRYSYATLLDAMVDYPTGYHEPIVVQRNAMIVVGK